MSKPELLPTLNGMVRPKKDPALRMDSDIRIPLTAGQKQIIAAAVADDPGGLASWARDVLLKAANQRLANRRRQGMKHSRGKRDGVP